MREDLSVGHIDGSTEKHPASRRWFPAFHRVLLLNGERPPVQEHAMNSFGFSERQGQGPEDIRYQQKMVTDGGQNGSNSVGLVCHRC